jgi:ribosome biogenesis protein SSF1/2
MAKRRTKKRTQVQGKDDSVNPKNGASATSQTPKSMVIRIGAGEVGSSVSQLVKDFRLMMEPDTASRLRERRANKLKDYTSMAGPLGVTHLILFTRSSTGNTNMRLARLCTSRLRTTLYAKTSRNP